MRSHLPYIWDYQIDENEFQTILRGEKRIGRLDQDWAAIRLLEYASYRDIIRQLSHSKAAGIFPADLARILCSTKQSDWQLIRWIEAPAVDKFIEKLYQLGVSLLPVQSD